MEVSDIKNILDSISADEPTAGVKDIAFVILSKEFGSVLLAYKTLFDKDADENTADIYDNSSKVIKIRELVSELTNRERKVLDDASSVTFEQNREEMIKMLDEIDRLLKNGELEAKDAIKMKTDIRTKLNDKFSVTSQQEQQQRVVVNTKFNFVCPHTRKECYVATKEDLIKKYNLVSMSEIKAKYELKKKVR